MQTAEHISNEAFERYNARRSDAAETLEVQAHIGECAACREKLAQVFDAEKAFAGLRNDFAFDDFADEPEHLPYENLALFVDGKMDEVEREIAESHLAICENCARDASDLRSYRTIAETENNAAIVSSTRAGTETIPFRRRVFGFNFSFLKVSVATLAVLFAVLLAVWFIARNQANRSDELANVNPDNQNTVQPSPAPTAFITNPPIDNSSNINSSTEPPPASNATDDETKTPPEAAPLLALNDASGQVTLDEKGNLRGLENLPPGLQQSVRQSLQTQKVTIPNTLKSLAGNQNGVLMGEDETRGVPFALQTPIGKVIRTNQPVLRWRALAGATKYSVAVVDSNFRVVAQSPALTATEWTPPALPRGANYAWQVTATKADGSETVSPSSPAPQAKFRILEQPAANELNRLEKSGVKSHLVRGTAFANAGLLDEAAKEFEALVRENPKSPIARKLLASVKSRR